ncbi:MAG: glycosyltransferase family 39 protein [Bacteroidia bacterium]|nr:glycosyltransferase family 39 protein [Bacteroidia bacterium]
MKALIRLLSHTIRNNPYPAALTGIGLFYLLFLPIDIMDIDAAQYASISREMSGNGNYLQVQQRGSDYLDKPPLLFWLVTLSFKIFGVHNFSFKLPAMLVLLLGLWSTFRAARLFYNERIAGSAAIILACMQGYFLMVNDVRTDGLLTGFTAFATWQLLSFTLYKKNLHLLLGGIGIGLAMLAKGPIGFVIPVAATGMHLLYKRDLRTIFNPRWLLVPLVALLCLLPMLYGLYQQYDLHPEKEVYGLKGPSGIRFFFWTQSFGRITGDIYWKDDSGPEFFLMSMGWDMAPWYLLFVAAFLYSAWRIVRHVRTPEAEAETYTFWGFLVCLAALSSSHYKLPHYVFPLFPFAAVQIAAFLYTYKARLPRALDILLNILQGIVIAAIPAMVILLSIYAFPLGTARLIAYCGVLAIAFFLIIKSERSPAEKWFLAGSSASFWLGAFMAVHFYPNLLGYQGTSAVGRYIEKMQVPQDRFYALDAHNYSLDFYARRIVPFTSEAALDTLPSGTFVLVNREHKTGILRDKPQLYRLHSVYPDYSVSLLKPGFLMQETREQHLRYIYLIQKQ